MVERGFVHYHDGSALGRGIALHHGRVDLAGGGERVWVHGMECRKRVMLRIEPVAITDLRAMRNRAGASPAGTFDELAELVRRTMARARWKEFGISATYSYSTRLGAVCLEGEDLAVRGLYELSPDGGLKRRFDGAWHDASASDLASSGEGPAHVWVPMVEGAVEVYDRRQPHGELAVNASSLKGLAPHSQFLRMRSDGEKSKATLLRLMSVDVV